MSIQQENMEGQQSEFRTVEQLSIHLESEDEYFDSLSDSELDEDIYLHKTTDSSESDEMEDTASSQIDEEEDIDIKQQTKSEDELSIYEENEYYRSDTSESEDEGQHSSIRDHIRPCVRYGAENVNNPLEAWSILLTDEILNIIVRYTNEEIDRRRVGLNSAQEDSYIYADLSLVEFKALLGLLYLSGLYKVTFTKTIDLWSSFSFPMYRATMPRERFVFLMRCIRFDDKATRRERCKQDKFSPIKEIFDKFVDNCKKYYTPHDHCTVGQLFTPHPDGYPFYKFLSVMRDEYGLKIMTMNDAKTYYMINASFCVNKRNTEPRETIHAYYLRILTQPIHGSGRNVTCCSNLPLYTHVMETLKTDYNLTLVSMVETKDPAIRDKFTHIPSRNRKLLKRLKSGILLPYYEKGLHLGTLQSSLHVSANNASNKELTEVVRNAHQFYRLTKNVTGTFNALCQKFSTIRATNRWSLRFFFTILDQCGYNSFILYHLNAKNECHVQRSFLDDLIINLIKPFIIMRINDPRTPSDLKLLMSAIFNIDVS